MSFTFAHATESVVLTAGTYKKVSIAGVDGKKTNKTGTAFLTVTEDGAAFYTNRRGEIEDKLAHKRVLAILRTGINTLMVDVETDMAEFEADVKLTHVPSGDDFRVFGNCLNY